ncbi:hypothetical protein KUCAC02_006542 [Chaenocephalus aceratus]|uniref:Uncharacterized protein n=1 Tax=Chaenocephalus aceratus TaxID=36190 RepID=A0ACB9VSR7_CHAAC|nr:hypothetical protein KUCAC02_006542 [Chaenocephalus aceratus]
MYQFSLKAFRVVFQRAVLRAEPGEVMLSNLTDSITSSVFQYTTRGLFECDKLTYSAQLTFQVLLMNKEINPAELDFLLRYPVQPAVLTKSDLQEPLCEPELEDDSLCRLISVETPVS